MKLFSRFGRGEKIEEGSVEQGEVEHKEPDIYDIEPTPKNWEERNRERERRIEEQTRRLREAGQNSLRAYTEKTDKIVADAEREVAYINSRMEAIDELPGNQHASELSGRMAQKILNDTDDAIKEEKLKKYKPIESFYARMNLGIFPADFSIENRRKYVDLSQDQKDDMALPYLVEKFALKAESQGDKEHLEKLIRVPTEKDIQQQYTSGIELLSSFGLVDIKDKEMFSASFNEYSLKTREEIQDEANK